MKMPPSRGDWHREAHLRSPAILVCGFDDSMARFLWNTLEKQGMHVSVEAEIFDAVGPGSDFEFDCAVVPADPESLKALRSAGVEIPLLAITEESSVEARLAALNAGSDDCIKSPFSVSELVARIGAHLRRYRIYEGERGAPDSGVDFEYIPELRLVKRSDRSVVLTRIEDMLLSCLLNEPETILNRRELTWHVWQSDEHDQTNLIAVHIANLRRKIDRGHRNRLIHTARGQGYFFSGDRVERPNRRTGAVESSRQPAGSLPQTFVKATYE